MSKVKFELPKDLFLKKKKKQNKIMNAFSKKTCKQLKKIFSVQFVFQPKIKKKKQNSQKSCLRLECKWILAIVEILTEIIRKYISKKNILRKQTTLKKAKEFTKKAYEIAFWISKENPAAIVERIVYV